MTRPGIAFHASLVTMSSYGKKDMIRYIGTLSALLTCLAVTPSSALDLYVGAKPQAQTNTCQSYASVLALAAKKDPAFPVENFDQLRRLEAEFRSILESLPNNNNPYVHTNWPRAMEQLTSGRYTFDLKYVSSGIVDWMQQTRAATTLSSDVATAVSALTGTGFHTVLTSVTKLDGSTYAGHIITVLGLAGSGLDSSTQLIAFNSAIKGSGGSVNTCSPGNEPGDTRYKAGVIQTDNFELRQFGDAYLLMTLRRK